MPPIRQGDIHYCEFPEPMKSRPVLILSHTELNAARENIVVALITKTVRGVALEVAVGPQEGLPKEGVASLADIHTVPRHLLSSRRGQLSPAKWHQAQHALMLLFSL